LAKPLPAPACNITHIIMQHPTQLKSQARAIVNKAGDILLNPVTQVL